MAQSASYISLSPFSDTMDRGRQFWSKINQDVFVIAFAAHRMPMEISEETSPRDLQLDIIRHEKRKLIGSLARLNGME